MNLSISGGRLPVTWYNADYVNKLPMSSMLLRPVDSKGYPGQTYKFFDGLNCASVWIWLKLHPVQVQSNILRISSRHKIRQTSALP